MAKAKKITKEELELVNTQQQKLNELLRGLGVLDVQKMNIHQQVKNTSDDIQKTKSDLEEKYGPVNIDLKNGTITKIDKKDVK